MKKKSAKNKPQKKPKIEIIPAILEKSFSRIEKKFSSVSKYAETIQIDIFDGRLVPSKTFASSGSLKSFERLKELQKRFFVKNKVNTSFELDLIIEMKNGSKGRGQKFLDSISYLQPKRVVFHFSGVKDWEKIFNHFSKDWKKYNQKKNGEKITKNKNHIPEIALGIWLSDDIRKVNKVLEKYPFSYMQIMGIEKVGYGGQKLSSKVYKKAAYYSKKYPELPIQIDGGVRLENIHKLRKSGVTRFVSGSGIFSASNIQGRIEEFKNNIKQ